MKRELDREKILLGDPIYTEFDLSVFDEPTIYKLFTSGSLDAFCPTCEKKSVFKIQDPNPNVYNQEEKKLTTKGVITVKAICSRSQGSGYLDGCQQKLFSVFERNGDSCTRIGLSPSKAILDFGELDESFRELSSNYRKELGTAIGLFAHGVGIGSFVYLRRIFEVLVEEAHAIAKEKNEDWDEHAYFKKRMKEKIESLEEYLPRRLVKSIDLYGVLSKGIHELTEDECKEKFPLVKQAIQLILKEKFEEKEYEKVSKSFGN